MQEYHVINDCKNFLELKFTYDLFISQWISLTYLWLIVICIVYKQRWGFPHVSFWDVLFGPDLLWRGCEVGTTKTRGAELWVLPWLGLHQSDWESKRVPVCPGGRFKHVKGHNVTICSTGCDFCEKPALICYLKPVQNNQTFFRL